MNLIYRYAGEKVSEPLLHYIRQPFVNIFQPLNTRGGTFSN